MTAPGAQCSLQRIRPATLIEALELRFQEQPDQTYVLLYETNDEVITEVSVAKLRGEASRLAAGLVRCGVAPG